MISLIRILFTNDCVVLSLDKLDSPSDVFLTISIS